MSDEQNIFEEENRDPGTYQQNGGSEYDPYRQNGGSGYDPYRQNGGGEYDPYRQNGGNGYNPYQQYTNSYQQPGGGKKKGQGFGIASFVLGIISLVLFCTCINFILGLLALIFGIIQIVRYEKKGLAIAGIVTSAVSFVLFFVCWALLLTSDEFLDTLRQDMYQYEENYDMEIYEDLDHEDTL